LKYNNSIVCGPIHSVLPADLLGPLSLSLCPSPGPCLASIFP
jgi:hypothetical protein